ncbi:MAG: hypothetical protein Q4A28_04750 [Brachymonas sp.]|nr:hypothetical protein [Brachymonas sp.]
MRPLEKSGKAFFGKANGSFEYMYLLGAACWPAVGTGVLFTLLYCGVRGAYALSMCIKPEPKVVLDADVLARRSLRVVCVHRMHHASGPREAQVGGKRGKQKHEQKSTARQKFPL